jgi:hypothetical protein
LSDISGVLVNCWRDYRDGGTVLGVAAIKELDAGDVRTTASTPVGLANRLAFRTGL